MKVPVIHEVPKSDPRIVGISDYRDLPTVIIDLNKSLDKKVPLEMGDDAHIVYTSFNNKTQAFLVDKVIKIVRLDWKSVYPPPVIDEKGGYLTSITKIDGVLVEILDVEKIIEDVTGSGIDSKKVRKENIVPHEISSQLKVLIVDDSAMARNKTKNVIDAMGLISETCNNGYEALVKLKNMAKELDVNGLRVEDKILLVITDIEMPQLDGLAFVNEIRNDGDLKNLYVVIQSSIVGGFRRTLDTTIGANGELIKWDEEKLIEIIQKRVQEL